MWIEGNSSVELEPSKGRIGGITRRRGVPSDAAEIGNTSKLSCG